MRNKCAAYCLTALCGAFLIGCAQTTLSGPALDPATIRLAAARNQALSYSVQASREPFIAGHQFVFIALPAGRVIISSPQQALQNAAYRALALRGFQPTLLSGASIEKPDLTLELRSLSVTAYDMLFVRLISAHAELVLHDTHRNLMAIGEGSHQVVRAFGFERQLEAALALAFERSLAQGFEQLPALGYRTSYETFPARTTAPTLQSH